MKTIVTSLIFLISIASVISVRQSDLNVESVPNEIWRKIRSHLDDPSHQRSLDWAVGVDLYKNLTKFVLAKQEYYSNLNNQTSPFAKNLSKGTLINYGLSQEELQDYIALQGQYHPYLDGPIIYKDFDYIPGLNYSGLDWGAVEKFRLTVNEEDYVESDIPWEKMSNLFHLDLYFQSSADSDYFKSFKIVPKLTIGCKESNCISAVKTVGRFCQSKIMKRLRLQYMDVYDEKWSFLRSVATTCASAPIESLRVDGWYPFLDSFLEALPAENNLRTLEILEWDTLSTDEDVGSKLADLTKLIIREKASGSRLRSLIKHMRNLSYVELHPTSSDLSFLGKVLGKNLNLKVLDIFYNDKDFTRFWKAYIKSAKEAGIQLSRIEKLSVFSLPGKLRDRLFLRSVKHLELYSEINGESIESILHYLSFQASTLITRNPETFVSALLRLTSTSSKLKYVRFGSTILEDRKSLFEEKLATYLVFQMIERNINKFPKSMCLESYDGSGFQIKYKKNPRYDVRMKCLTEMRRKVFNAAVWRKEMSVNSDGIYTIKQKFPPTTSLLDNVDKSITIEFMHLPTASEVQDLTLLDKIGEISVHSLGPYSSNTLSFMKALTILNVECMDDSDIFPYMDEPYKTVAQVSTKLFRTETVSLDQAVLGLFLIFPNLKDIKIHSVKLKYSNSVLGLKVVRYETLRQMNNRMPNIDLIILSMPDQPDILNFKRKDL